MYPFRFDAINAEVTFQFNMSRRKIKNFFRVCGIMFIVISIRFMQICKPLEDIFWKISRIFQFDPHPSLSIFLDYFWIFLHYWGQNDQNIFNWMANSICFRFKVYIFNLLHSKICYRSTLLVSKMVSLVKKDWVVQKLQAVT